MYGTVILDFGHHNIKMLHMRCLLLGLKAESGEEGSRRKQEEDEEAEISIVLSTVLLQYRYHHSLPGFFKGF